MKKSLFKDNTGETYTNDAIALSREISHALAPIINKAMVDGYWMREVAYVIDNEVDTLISTEILNAVIADIKKK